jgi:hypothetical protein
MIFVIFLGVGVAQPQGGTMGEGVERDEHASDEEEEEVLL